MLVLRMNLPTFVTRGSFSILTKAFSISSCFSLLKSLSATTKSSPTSITSSSLIIMSDSMPMSIIIISASKPSGAVMTGFSLSSSPLCSAYWLPASLATSFSLSSRTELQEVEDGIVGTYTLRLEQYRPLALQTDGNGGNDKDGRQDNDGKE